MQYHYDVVDTIFGKFFILDSSKGLHYLIKNNDTRVKKIKDEYSPIKKLFNSSLKNQLSQYFKGELKNFSCNPKICRLLLKKKSLASTYYHFL